MGERGELQEFDSEGEEDEIGDCVELFTIYGVNSQENGVNIESGDKNLRVIEIPNPAYGKGGILDVSGIDN